MFPFLGKNMKKNSLAYTRALEKMRAGSLSVEDVLDDEALVEDLKSFTYTNLMNFLTHDNMKKIMRYTIEEPLSEDSKVAYKFPFNASEILCSENVFVIDKFFENLNESESDNADSLDEIQIKDENTFSGRKSVLFESSDLVNESDQEKDLAVDKLKSTTVQDVEISNNTIKPDLNVENQNEIKNDFDNLEVNTSECNNESHGTNYPLIDYLFTFLEQDNELNYVLSGYFYKLFTHILNSRKNLVMVYLFKAKPHLLDSLIKHTERKSIADCIARLLFLSTEDQENNNNKANLIIKILDNFDSVDEERKENILDLILDLLRNRRMYCLIAKSKEILEKIYLILKIHLKKSHQIGLLKIVIKFIEQVTRDMLPAQSNDEPEADSFIDVYEVQILETEFSFKVDLSLKNYSDIFGVIYLNLDSVIEDFIEIGEFEESGQKINFNQFKIGTLYFSHSSIIENTFETKSKCLGSIKIYELEYIKSILELLLSILNNQSLVEIDTVHLSINKLIEKIISYNVFENIFKFYFFFELNNFYQNIFEKIISLACQKCLNENFILHIFNTLPEKIILHLFSEGTNFTSGNSILPGYFASLCRIASIMNNSENIFLQGILRNSILINYLDVEWEYLTLILFKKVETRFSKGLLSENKNTSPFCQANQKDKINFFMDNFSLKSFVQIFCQNRFLSFKEKILEGRALDVLSYIKDEEAHIGASNLAQSIPLESEDKFSIGSSVSISCQSESDEINCNSYSDLNFYWKNYNVNFDISELL